MPPSGGDATQNELRPDGYTWAHSIPTGQVLMGSPEPHRTLHRYPECKPGCILTQMPLLQPAVPVALQSPPSSSGTTGARSGRFSLTTAGRGSDSEPASQPAPRRRTRIHQLTPLRSFLTRIKPRPPFF